MLGKIPTTSVRRLSSLLTRSIGLVDQILAQWAWGKSANAVRSSLASRSMPATPGQLHGQGVGDSVELVADRARGGSGEHGADVDRDHVGLGLGDLGQHVAQEVQPAALPGRALQHRGDRGLEPGVRVGDDQLDPCRPRPRRSRRNSVQNASVSLSPTAQPRTSRCPSARTPVAITTAWDTTRPLTRALQ